MSDSNDPRSLLDIFKDRIGHPLFGPFLFSWAIANWNIVVALIFASPTTPDRIVLVDRLIDEQSCWELLFIPIIAAISYFYFAPMIAEHFANLALESKKRLKIKAAKEQFEANEIVEFKQTLRIVAQNLFVENRALVERMKQAIKFLELHAGKDSQAKQFIEQMGREVNNAEIHAKSVDKLLVPQGPDSNDAIFSYFRIYKEQIERRIRKAK